MNQTNTPDTGNTPQGNTPATGITPEVGKRYVTRDGRVTPPLQMIEHDVFSYGIMVNDMLLYKWMSNGRVSLTEPHNHDLISEYVEPTAPTDTFRRDLIARLYVAMVASSVYQYTPYPKVAKEAILFADTLIKAMEARS